MDYSGVVLLAILFHRYFLDWYETKALAALSLSVSYDFTFLSASHPLSFIMGGSTQESHRMYSNVLVNMYMHFTLQSCQILRITSIQTSDLKEIINI